MIGSPPDPAFTANRAEPVHRWTPWIAGFSSEFVEDSLRRYLPAARDPETLMLDPFAGVGTTLVVAAHAGCSVAGFEINPYAALAARTKLRAVDLPVARLEALTPALQEHMCRRQEAGAEAPPIPAGFKSRIPFFSPAVEEQALRALTFIHAVQDDVLRDCLLVAFGAVMVSFSNYSYEPSLGSRPGCGKPLIEQADVCGAVLAKLREMILDCRTIQARSRPRIAGARRDVFQDTIFHAERHLPEDCADLAITSPPYLNNYHYVRNTRPQLFWLGLVQSTADLRHIEQESFGRFWQTVRGGPPIRLAFDLPALERVLDCIRATNSHRGVYGGGGWASYAAQYFNDMNRFCAVMARLLKPGGRLVVVIGNSILQGFEIKVEEMLAAIAGLNGLARVETRMLRQKRVGNSIIRSGARSAASEPAALYEVAVVLERPGSAPAAGRTAPACLDALRKSP